VRFAALTLIAVPFCAATASAQTVSGQVLSLSTRKPLPAVRVALVDDSARIDSGATGERIYSVPELDVTTVAVGIQRSIR
jgi:hypothetical protein